MDNIGNRAKELNKDLEDIVRRLQTMSDINYDKNKIDYLFSLLESSLESEAHVGLITERLTALERIHKESPNIESSINTIVERQKLIDLSFKAEDQQILKTKKAFVDSMYEVQNQLKEVTLLQKEKFGDANNNWMEFTKSKDIKQKPLWINFYLFWSKII